jgi:hypothetical protein
MDFLRRGLRHAAIAATGRHESDRDLEGFHGSFPLQGEFRKGLIHFAGSSDGGGIRHSDDSNDIDLFAIGTLQPDGSLQGTLVSTVGNLTWRAERKTVQPGGPSSEHLRH